ncbi:3723_t:CDS:10 [Acaulospora morrowiae]|uniref:DNA-directed DNA polymerase n=1 Tax=Acaulospora morrowiae TaxID=94023 RepID=A0A9N8VWQ5_9GLOM|nr:3723_t:CDS:10 [Acaulospora morrowiae]
MESMHDLETLTLDNLSVSEIRADHFLSSVDSVSIDSISTSHHADVSYNDMPEFRDKLIIREKSFRQQFANLYFVRLVEMRPVVLMAAQKRWNVTSQERTTDEPHAIKHVDRILDVKSGETCYVIGTVYMDMQFKPNILDDVTKEHWDIAPSPRSKYCSDDDKVFLEDESGRIILTGEKLKQEIIVTGVIMAVLGKENAEGEFEVYDVCFAGLPNQAKSIQKSIDDDKYIALICGLKVGENASALPLQMMIEYLTGEIGSLSEQNFSSKIARIIIAGNSLPEVKIMDDDRKQKKYGYDGSMYNAELCLELDDIIDELCSTVPVDLMPGNNDPTNSSLPQQPIIPNLLPKANQHSTFHSVTNPYWCELDGVVFLGTSGQTIDDIYKYVSSEDRLKFAERTLHWRHIAPTAPDTLWCYPFQDVDPFIMSQAPHIYFISNQKEFATSTIEGPDKQRTRIILLPSFAETGVVVLVNLKNLKCHPIFFSSLN